MNEQRPTDVEEVFFDSLIKGDADKLGETVSEDMILIDVMSGAEITGQQLAEVIQSGNLKFESIERIDFRVRLYNDAAVITGQTIMAGVSGGQQFRVKSAYTHVFAKCSKGWRMVSAQGTPIR